MSKRCMDGAADGVPGQAEGGAQRPDYDNRPRPARPGGLPDGHRAAHRRNLRPAWNTVDLQVGTIEVRATAVRVRGQGLVVKSTKTDAGTRTLVLPRWCTAMLREWAARL